MICDSIAHLLSAAIPSDNFANVLGYYSPADGGGGDFYWDAGDTSSTDNGGTVFISSVDPNGRWKRLFSGSVNAKWFGAKGNGSSDDTNPMDAIFDFCNNARIGIYFPSGRYLFSNSISITTNGLWISGDSKSTTILHYQGTENAFIIGDRDTPAAVQELKFNDFELRGTGSGVSNSKCGIYAGIKYSFFTNFRIRGFQVGMDFKNSWTNKYYNVEFFSNDIGFRTGRDTNANSFVNCNFSNNRVALNLLDSFQALNFTGGQMEGNQEAAIKITGLAQIKGLVVSGCYFENPGVFLLGNGNYNLAGLDISGNLISTGTDNLAIDIAVINGSIVGSISNNVFYKSGVSVNPFINSLSGTNLTYSNNKAFYGESNAPNLFTTESISNNTSFTEIVNNSHATLKIGGRGRFLGGLVVGNNEYLPAMQGQMVQEPITDKLKFYPSASGAKYIALVVSGTNSNRPAAPARGESYFDTTLSKPIWWNGTAWVDSTGAIV